MRRDDKFKKDNYIICSGKNAVLCIYKLEMLENSRTNDFAILQKTQNII